MTHKLLGKRAEVSLTGEAPKVAAAKNKALNWTLLGLSFIGAAMFFALLPLLYFYPPDVVWSFHDFQNRYKIGGFPVLDIFSMGHDDPFGYRNS